MMIKTPEPGTRDNFRGRRGPVFHGSMVRRVLVERIVSSVLVVVEHIVSNERIDVRAGVTWLPFPLLRRHVPGRPHHFAYQRQRVIPRTASYPGQSKIQQLHARLRHQNVCRLQVAVDDALAVCRVECVTNLAGILQRFIRGSGPFKGCPSMYSITR
jgi:hypothetical protein